MRYLQTEKESSILVYLLCNKYHFIHELGKIRGDLSIKTLRTSAPTLLNIESERVFFFSNILANSEDSINNCIRELIRRVYNFCEQNANKARSYYSKQKIVYHLCISEEYYDAINNAFRREFISKIDIEEKPGGDLIFTIEI